MSSSPSAGTGLIDFSVPNNPRGLSLWTGNYIVARVEGDIQLLTSAQLHQLLRQGMDIIIMSPGES